RRTNGSASSNGSPASTRRAAGIRAGPASDSRSFATSPRGMAAPRPWPTRWSVPAWSSGLRWPSHPPGDWPLWTDPATTPGRSVFRSRNPADNAAARTRNTDHAASYESVHCGHCGRKRWTRWTAWLDGLLGDVRDVAHDRGLLGRVWDGVAAQLTD